MFERGQAPADSRALHDAPGKAAEPARKSSGYEEHDPQAD
jgi:hypothetical protein